MVKALLLSLLLLSCIVALIEELINTLFSTLDFTLQPFQMAQLPSNMDMNINSNIIRGMFAFSSRISSREFLTYLIVFLSPYHKRMEMQNNLLNKDV